MNHIRAAALLHDFVDDDLNPGDRSGLERHLAVCAECRAEVAYLDALRRRAADLRRPAAPPEDLWPGIAAAIARNAEGGTAPREDDAAYSAPVRRPERWRVPGLPFMPSHLAAAATAAAILLGAAVLWHGGPDLASTGAADPSVATAPPAAALVAAGPAGSVATAAALAAVTRPDPRERIAFAALTGPPVTGPAGDAFRLGLAQLDEAIVDLETAWLADPGNVRLAYRLASVYQDRALLQTRADRLNVQL